MKGAGHDNLAGLQMGFEPYDAVPERVRKSRHALGLTQEQVVDRVRAIADRPDGWPRDGSWLGKIEDGTNKIAGLDDAMILARALEVSVAYLVGEVPYDIAGYDELSEHDKQEIAALIAFKRALQCAQGGRRDRAVQEVWGRDA